MAKNLLLGLILARVGSKVGSPIFFLKNLASSVTKYGQLSSSTISEKTNNDWILRKFSDGLMDGETDRRTETDGRE